MRRTLAVAAAVLALVATACGTRVKEWPDGALEPTDYYAERTVVSGEDEDEGAATADDDGGSDAPKTTSVTTKAKPGSGESTPKGSASGELPAPAPGTYTYDETSDEEDPTTSTITWAVERGSSSVTLTSTESEGDEDFSLTVVSKYRVTTTALELLSVTSTFDDEEPETCTYKPPILALKLPLEVGNKWKVSGNCEGEDESDEEVEFVVTGTANDVVGGKAVKTFVVTAKDSFDSTDDTTGERTTISFEDSRHIDPATLLTVVEDQTVSFDGEKSTRHRKLRSLTPT